LRRSGGRSRFDAQAHLRPRRASRRLYFFDRDGVINERLPDPYVLNWDQMRLYDEALIPLARVAKRMPQVIASNQRCVSLGLISAAEIEALMERLAAELAGRGVPIAAWYVCPHADEDGGVCRKPLPGLLLAAAQELGVDLRRSFLLGDSESDIGAARAAGCAAAFLVDGSRQESVESGVREVLRELTLC
jgi:D-glycero-D-manno-heptose 1,7-bisphosphate phosphatase